MHKFRLAAVLSMFALALTGCGGGDDASKFSDPGAAPPGAPPASTVTSLSVLASTPTLPSNGATPVDISVFARNASNAFVSGETVTFSASSGGLQVTQATTDSNGLAKATLTTAGDRSNRAITVTAAVGTVTSQVVVNVSGSQLAVQGPSAMVIGQQGSYTLRLIDSAGGGIPGQSVTLSSAKGNTLSATSVTTDSTGNAAFTLTVANSGNDTVTAASMGISTPYAVAVNSDSFSFTLPAANKEVILGANETVTVRWLQSGNPVAGQPVSFASTRGNVSAASVNTDGSGNATITITSPSAGGSVITASAAGGATAQLPMEFVATSASSIDVQPAVFTLAPGEQSALTATVRDGANNLVKNKTVTFSLEDVTGGTLTTASAVTDSQGRAQSTYVAGPTTSANEGVKITARVQGTSVLDDVKLTVAQRQVFISVGTGNDIEKPTNLTQYAIPYVVQVTDSNGNGVANVPLQLSVLSLRYIKGTRGTVTPLPNNQVDECVDEDDNHNGVLDVGEDFNGSTRIEAGNIATVTPGNATTDASGFANIKVFYPKEYAYYLTVRLDVRAAVAGTEFVRSSTFMLAGTKDDFDGTKGPPGPISPFGTHVCTAPD